MQYHIPNDTLCWRTKNVIHGGGTWVAPESYGMRQWEQFRTSKSVIYSEADIVRFDSMHHCRKL
jgi:hypothetical protein